MDKPSRFNRDGVLEFDDKKEKKEEKEKFIPDDLAGILANKTLFFRFLVMLRSVLDINKPVLELSYLFVRPKVEYHQAVWVHEGMRVFYMKILMIGFMSLKKKDSKISEDDFKDFLKNTDNIFVKKRAYSNMDVINFSEFATYLYPFLYNHFGIEYGLEAKHIPSYFYKQGVLNGLAILEKIAKKEYFNEGVNQSG